MPQLYLLTPLTIGKRLQFRSGQRLWVDNTTSTPGCSRHDAELVGITCIDCSAVHVLEPWALPQQLPGIPDRCNGILRPLFKPASPASPHLACRTPYPICKDYMQLQSVGL